MLSFVSGKEANLQKPVLEVSGLQKNYGAFQALKGISLEIEEGEIFGLIGPDGAGKTTAFHILAGIMQKTAGELKIFGQDPQQIRLSIGYLTQTFSLYPDLSINENIEYAGRIREVGDKDLKERRRRYLQIMGLDRFGERLAANLSGGMKQKLALCCALVARPRLLLLDEPTTGVDPVSRRDFWDVLGAVSAEGVTVAVATPYLDEAERCSRIALLHKGEILQCGTPQELKEKLGMKRLEIRSSQLDEVYDLLESRLALREPSDLKQPSHLKEPLDSQLAYSGSGSRDLADAGASPDSTASKIADLQLFGDRLDLLVHDQALAEKQVRDLLGNAGLELEITGEDATLENVFVSGLTGLDLSPDIPFPQDLRAPRSGEAIGADKISKRFGAFQAVKNLSLSINYGEIYGLLGANGAGKTTTIKMLCGLLDISGGRFALAGRSKDLRSVSLRREIGYMSQKFVLYDDLSVIENLNFYCGSYGLSKTQRQERIDWAISTFELDGYENTMAASLPGGWKQKLSFAASVLHQPSIIFLDEPTSGCDPLARRQLWKYIRRFARSGAAVLVTTHFLEEAEHCGRLGFMVEGELVSQGSPSQIKESQPGILIALKVSDLQGAYKVLQAKMEHWKVSIFGASLHLVLEAQEELEGCRRELEAKGISILSSRTLPFSLEDSFIGIVQRSKKGAA